MMSNGMKLKNSRNLAGSRSKGFSLIELMVAVGVIGIIAYALGAVMTFVGTTAVRSREQAVAANLAERFFTRLNSLPYIYVFDMDSSSTNFRLNGSFGDVSTQQNPFPYLATFREFDTLMRSHKFDRFTLDIRFMPRDLSDENHDGKTTDLRYFEDTNNNLIDDYDSALRYLDQNADGDYQDVYGSPQVTEQPHTRLKEATFKLYKLGQLKYTETQLVSWEKLTGAEGKAAGATLTLLVSTPTEGSAIYTLVRASHSASFNLPITIAYPSDIVAFRSDASSVLRIQGETTPGATLSWRLGATTSTVQDNGCLADYLGIFDCPATNINAALPEGLNTIYGQAYKTVYYSPWTSINVIRDVSTPTITAMEPTGTIYNLQPTVRAKFKDSPHNAGKTTAGVVRETLRLKLGDSTPLNHEYDSSTDYVTWIDSTTLVPPLLETGAYTIVLEGGDAAFYKNRSTWTFTIGVSTDDFDDSAPNVNNKSPIGSGAIPNPPIISVDVQDNQSGIRMDSIVLTLDGVVVVSSATGNLYSSCTPLLHQDGYTVTFTPPDTLSAGTHNLTITASHWALNYHGVTSKVTTTDAWSFTY